jgi:hypothetical protein
MISESFRMLFRGDPSPIGVLAAIVLGMELGNAIRKWREQRRGR